MNEFGHNSIISRRNGCFFSLDHNYYSCDKAVPVVVTVLYGVSVHTGNSVRDLIPIVAVLSALFALGCLLYVERLNG